MKINVFEIITEPIVKFTDTIRNFLLMNYRHYDSINIEDNAHIKELIETGNLYNSIDGFLDMLHAQEIEKVFFNHDKFLLTDNNVLKKVNTKTKTFMIENDNGKTTNKKLLDLKMVDLPIIVKELERLGVIWRISKDEYTMFHGFLDDPNNYKVYGNEKFFEFYTIKRWKFK